MWYKCKIYTRFEGLGMNKEYKISQLLYYIADYVLDLLG